MTDHRITDPEQLRSLYGAPMQRALDKVASTIGAPHRRFIERSPFFVIGSRGPEGADVSPRGDAPGFVGVVDASTLAIPDRVGNRRVDTLLNVLSDPQVGLIFFIPGLNETLRINGVAHVSRDPDLLDALAHDGKPAITALVVEVREVFHQCVRALRRSGLWDPEQFVAGDFPRISSTPESEYDDKLY